MNGKNLKYFVLGAALVAVGFGAIAVNIPNTFSSGQVISAAALNANFVALKAAVDSLESPKTRTLSFPGGAISTTATQSGAGPLFGGSTGGTIVIPRPADWNRTSNVTVDVYLFGEGAGSGDIGFSIRPRSHDGNGDTVIDVPAIVSTPIPGAQGQFLRQTFTVPAAQWSTKAVWQLVIQRSTTDSYPGLIAVESVVITYIANP